MAQRKSAKRFLNAQTMMGLVNSIYVLIMSGWCVLVGALPLTLVLLLIHDLQYWPTFVVAAALSAPGIAALFAVFRDHPALFARNAAVRASIIDDNADDPAFPPDWIAEAYVPVDTMVMVIRPYFRAYAKVFARSLLMGLTFGAAIFLLLYDVQIMLQLGRVGAALVPVLLVMVVLLVQSLLLSLVLVVEYPKARYLSLIKGSVLLCVRRFWVTILTAVLLFAYWWGVAENPLMVVVLFTGLIVYIVWASVRWQAQVMMKQMAIDSGDRRIMAMYGIDPDNASDSAGRAARRGSLFSGTTDFQQ